MSKKINFEMECGICFAEAHHLPALNTDPLTMCDTHKADWAQE
jgi:hypothetical protein